MRFVADGPSLPSHLLEQQQLGSVVFLCGAGLSMPAGLPDFAGLTGGIVDSLSAVKARKVWDDGQSLDRVFNQLFKDYGRQEIDRQLFKALSARRSAVLDNHRSVLSLARGPDGARQIVTTNFDLLFQKADRSLRSLVAPHLPDLELQPRFDGVVYLHGRLEKSTSGMSSGYIIGASDFGRAYLADAWASRFVKALRERYTLVLLGYRAEDPPMRYLLEGLNSRGNDAYESPIYSLVSGDQGDAEEEWFDRGVTPICYDPSNKHQSLWATLKAWASAVDDPTGWTAHLSGLAQQKPAELKPFERGQVAQWVSTKKGAKAFADVSPGPPAEWLCVFDNFVRYAKPGWVDPQERKKIDPLDLFGMDDDPARPLPAENGTVQTVGANLLETKLDDDGRSNRQSLVGTGPEWYGALPERLFHLSRWFVRAMDQPAAIWWSAGYRQLNSGLNWHIDQRLRDKSKPLSETAALYWRLQREFSPPPEEYEWYSFKERVEVDGWGDPILRALEKLLQPRVAFSRYLYSGPRPPEADWSDLHLHQVAEPAVRVVDRHGDSIEVPNEYLKQVVEIMRRSLVRCGQLLDETHVRYWSAPTLHPAGAREETFHGRKALHFLWFKELFLRLVAVDTSAATAEIECWDLGDRYFFGKLSIFAAMLPDIVSAKHAFSILDGVSNAVFWDRDCQRELLFTLRARWKDFSVAQRRRVEMRIRRGPERWEDEKAGPYRKRKSTVAASRLRWLELNGCSLSVATTARLARLKVVDPRWNDEWARSADDSLSVKSGWVQTIKEVQGLDQLPASQVVAAATALTQQRHGEFTSYRPFDGLVGSRPFHALAALRISLKKGETHNYLWKSLLSEWPKETSLRLRWLMAETLSRLPPALALELRHYLPRWLRDHIEGLYKVQKSKALAVFDGVAAPYLVAPDELTESGMGNATIGGVEQRQSPVSIGKAMNAPVGVLAECLWSLLPKKVSNKRKMPSAIGNRLQTLFRVPGHGGGHAVCIIAQHMGWLDYCYNAWTQQVMVPLLDLTNALSEAAWHGLSRDNNGLTPDTFGRVKPDFLGTLNGQMGWVFDKSEYRTQVQRLVYLTMPSGRGPAYVSFAEAREVLTNVDAQGRADAIWALSNILEGDKTGDVWPNFVRPFLEQAWPRELRFRTDEVARSFARLVECSGDHFPEAVSLIVPFLRPLSHLDLITYRLAQDRKAGNPNFATKFPAATLRLLDAVIADDRSQMPYELGSALATIAEADPSLRQTKAWRRLNELGG